MPHQRFSPLPRCTTIRCPSGRRNGGYSYSFPSATYSLVTGRNDI